MKVAMRTHVIGAVACIGLVGGAVRADWPPSFADFDNLQLEPLRARGTPVLYSECFVPPELSGFSDADDIGKIALILPLGSSEGEFVSLWWKRDQDHPNPQYSNAAEVTIMPKVQLGELGHGGIATRHILTEEMKFLLTQRFVFVRPENFGIIAASDPTVTCPNVELPDPFPENHEQEEEDKDTQSK